MFISPETIMPLLQPRAPSTPEPYADFVLGVDGTVTERKAGVISDASGDLGTMRPEEAGQRATAFGLQPDAGSGTHQSDQGMLSCQFEFF
jgi:hypothetical protein